MIAAVITDTSITFIAKGRPWTLAVDHPKFGSVKALLQSGTDDVDSVVMLTDVRVAVDAATEGQAVLTEDALIFNGEEMSSAWRERSTSSPAILRSRRASTSARSARGATGSRSCAGSGAAGISRSSARRATARTCSA